jgi:hypothetical protein
MGRKCFFFGCLVWLLSYGLSRCLADDAKPPPRFIATVPFTLGSDGRMYVQARINGQVEATFLLDTGNDVNYLSADLQDKLHLPLTPVTDDGKAGGKPSLIEGRQLMGIEPASVLLGNLNVTQTWFLLLPAKKLSESALTHRPVDGVIGSRTLSRFAMLLDFSRNRLVLWYPSGLTKPEISALNLTVLYTVPISPSPGNHDIWVAHVQFTSDTAAARQDMMIDTGAMITTIPAETADRLKLVGSEGGTATLFLNKKVTIEASQVTQMQMGNFVLFSHTVRYPERPLPSYPVSVGMDIFRGYLPLIDFGQNVMYLAIAGLGVDMTIKK